MRAALNDTRELAKKLAALEQELIGSLDVHEAAIVDVLQRIMTILDPPPAPPEPPRPQIGFKEDAVPYPTAFEAAMDGSGCSLSRQTGQGEGGFGRNALPVRQLFLHKPLELGGLRIGAWGFF